MVRYHDREWGVPCFDDRHLFEMPAWPGRTVRCRSAST
jgi:3-methyladenine DNA glycosylase Tag